jgi:hypothetical protein
MKKTLAKIITKLKPACRILLLATAIAACLPAGEWRIGFVDGSLGGKSSSLRIDKFGNAHVAYTDPEQSLLQYSFWDHELQKWFTKPIGGGSAFLSLTLDSKESPHISLPGPASVLHVYWDGKSWQTQPIPIAARVINYYTSIMLDSHDKPAISFYEEAGLGDNFLRLRVVSWDMDTMRWIVRTVDGDHGSGKFNSMAIDSAGRLQIAYGNVEYMNLSLRYARWSGSAWQPEILESTGDSMWSVAMILDKDDVPHIAYSNLQKKLVKYATKQNGKWVFQVVDGISKVAYPDRNGIALDAQGNPYISYYDAGEGVLKVAYRKGDKWVHEIVDQDFAGLNSSLQIYDTTIWITYADEAGGRLKFARGTVEQAAPAPVDKAKAKAVTMRK